MRLLIALSALALFALPSAALAANPCGEAAPGRDATGLTMKGSSGWDGEKPKQDWKVIFQTNCQLSNFYDGEWDTPGTWSQTPDGVKIDLNGGYAVYTGAWINGRDIKGTQVNVAKLTGTFNLTRTKAYDVSADLKAAADQSMGMERDREAAAQRAAASPPQPPPMSARGACGPVRDAYNLAGNKYRGNVRWEAREEPVDLIVTLRADCSVSFVEDGVQGAGKWAQDGRELILVLGEGHDAYKGKLDGSVFDGAVNDQHNNFGSFTLRQIG